MGSCASMRVILETHVLRAALISPHGPPDIIYRAWRAARFELLTSTVQLEELRRTIVLDTLPPPPGDMDLSDPNDIFCFPWHGPVMQITW